MNTSNKNYYNKIRYDNQMKKPLLIFIVIVIVLIAAKVIYTKYCASKVQGCKEEKLKDSILSDDHMDN